MPAHKTEGGRQDPHEVGGVVRHQPRELLLEPRGQFGVVVLRPKAQV